MCTFITSWVTGSVDKAQLKAILSEHGFDLDDYPDSPIRRKLGAPIYFRPTLSQCDCGTILGGKNQKGVAESPMEAQVERLRRKGWGEAKIGKWLADRERSSRKTTRGKSRNDGATAREWLNLITRLLKEPGIKSFGILFHHYHGDQTTEDFDLEGKVELDLKKLAESDLETLRPETPYEISEPRHRYGFHPDLPRGSAARWQPA